MKEAPASPKAPAAKAAMEEKKMLALDISELGSHQELFGDRPDEELRPPEAMSREAVMLARTLQILRGRHA